MQVIIRVMGIKLSALNALLKEGNKSDKIDARFLEPITHYSTWRKDARLNRANHDFTRLFPRAKWEWRIREWVLLAESDLLAALLDTLWKVMNAIPTVKCPKLLHDEQTGSSFLLTALALKTPSSERMSDEEIFQQRLNMPKLPCFNNPRTAI